MENGAGMCLYKIATVHVLWDNMQCLPPNSLLRYMSASMVYAAVHGDWNMQYSAPMPESGKMSELCSLLMRVFQMKLPHRARHGLDTDSIAHAPTCICLPPQCMQLCMFPGDVDAAFWVRHKRATNLLRTKFMGLVVHVMYATTMNSSNSMMCMRCVGSLWAHMGAV